MAIRIAGALMTLSFVFALLTGKMEALSEAALIGSGKAVTVTLSLLGMMCLWGGLMRVAERAGLLRSLTRLLSPLLRRLFPDAAARGKGLPEISAALAANMLGIGNAATPLSLAAMKALHDGSDRATDDMVTFTVLGTAFPSLLPTTVITLRAAAGSDNPTDLIPLVWICSTLLAILAVLLSRALRRRART